MKIVAISDTHNQHSRLVIPECDVLVHAGDHGGHGYNHESLSFINWLSQQDQAKHKIFIAGNHDFCFMKKPSSGMEFIKNLIPSNIIYLQDSSVVIDGVKFYGSPWSPFFYDWAFNGLEFKPDQGYNYKGGPGANAHPDAEHPLLERVYGQIPHDTDVVICHSPPAINEISKARDGNFCGSHELLKAIHARPHISIGIYGHIHEGRGIIKDKVTKITHYNACSLDRDYATLREPYEIEYNDNISIS